MIKEALQYIFEGRRAELAASEHYLTKPREIDLVDLEAYAETPRRRAASPVFHAAQSFADYLNLHKNANTRLFASTGEMLAVIDHLPPVTGASWRSHRAKLEFRFAPEYLPWRNAIGSKQFGQAEFADFIDDNSAVIISPDSAVIAEAAINLSDTRTLSVNSKINRVNGRFHFVYSEGGETGAAIVPEKLRIRTPVYQGSKPVEIDINIRFRIKEGAIVFTLVSPGLARLVDEQRTAVFEQVKDDTGLQYLLGVDG